MLVGTLSAPDDTSRGSRGIEAGVRLVAFVGRAEVAVSLGLLLCLHPPQSQHWPAITHTRTQRELHTVEGQVLDGGQAPGIGGAQDAHAATGERHIF